MLTTQDIVDYFGSDALVHLHVGMAIYVGVQLLMRTRRASFVALHCVIAAAVMKEFYDRLTYGSWRWDDTKIDLLATVMWPLILHSVSRYRRQRWAVDQMRAQKIREWIAKHHRVAAESGYREALTVVRRRRRA